MKTITINDDGSVTVYGVTVYGPEAGTYPDRDPDKPGAEAAPARDETSDSSQSNFLEFKDRNGYGFYVPREIRDQIHLAGFDAGAEAVRLTIEERIILNCLADAWTRFGNLDGSSNDRPEFSRHIDALQAIVASRVARRADPDVWR